MIPGFSATTSDGGVLTSRGRTVMATVLVVAIMWATGFRMEWPLAGSAGRGVVAAWDKLTSDDTPTTVPVQP